MADLFLSRSERGEPRFSRVIAYRYRVLHAGEHTHTRARKDLPGFFRDLIPDKSSLDTAFATDRNSG